MAMIKSTKFKYVVSDIYDETEKLYWCKQHEALYKQTSNWIGNGDTLLVKLWIHENNQTF